MENHNQSCTAIPQTATGPSVCMGGPSHNETFFPPTNLPHDDGYEYEPYVNDDPVALFGDDDERVEGCSSSDDNSEDQLSMLHVVQVDNLNVRPLPSRQESQGWRTAGSESSRPTTQDDGNRWSSPAYTAEDIPCPSYVIPTLSGVSCGVIEVGKVFENKLELKTKAHLYAMKQNFKFVGKKSVALDANNHLYPVAFGIVDSENHDSWKYFMSKLKEAIGEFEDLAFVSDRHASITHALETIFPDAYHGACYHHISMNVVAKFKTDHCHVLMYNIMTSNYAESFNNKTRDARSFPITTFVEFIRFTLQSWFCNRRETSEKTTTTLAPTYEKNLVDMAEKARFLIPYAIGRHEFHVLDGELNGEVDLLNKACTCGVFQIIGIPCAHALSGSLKRGVNFYSLCLDYYKIETWRSSYTESIYPTGDEEEWNVPHDIMTITVRTPAQKNPVGRPKKKQGRPKTKRHPSNGDKLVVPRKCSTCGGLGHNRATCKVRV
ncbi:uncharacterized protein LOC133806796 [Humulus lupulus]|uniref:uncharacterized protein LOC133806796 n=1 Tax=Humulus lupulus TaxID=3486 RepID=UPI002B409991|nr:uncharacterized protein LOC133806796 [Humulus lupulus]